MDEIVPGSSGWPRLLRHRGPRQEGQGRRDISIIGLGTSGGPLPGADVDDEGQNRGGRERGNDPTRVVALGTR
ncbi:MAG: hypothetical protein DMD61_04015 [Gemmatimonadetes bacterium]|nr:MAG: hypothetical protein DMD61_04015 [Gemmatimonadota bacterium]